MIKRNKRFSLYLKYHIVIWGIIGLGAGILYSFGGLVIDLMVSLNWIESFETPGLGYGTLLAFGALIGMPILFASFGLFIGLLEQFVSYTFSKWLIKLNILPED